MWFIILPFHWHAHLLVRVLGMPCLKQPNMLLTIVKCVGFFEVSLKGASINTKNYNLDKKVWEGEARMEGFMHHCWPTI